MGEEEGEDVGSEKDVKCGDEIVGVEGVKWRVVNWELLSVEVRKGVRFEKRCEIWLNGLSSPCFSAN